MCCEIINYYSKLSFLFHFFCPSRESNFNMYITAIPVVDSIFPSLAFRISKRLSGPFPIVILLQHWAAVFSPTLAHPLSRSPSLWSAMITCWKRLTKPEGLLSQEGSSRLCRWLHCFIYFHDGKQKGKTEQERRQPRRGTPEELTLRILGWRAEFCASQQKRTLSFFSPLNRWFNWKKCCTEIILGFCSSILMSLTCKNLPCRWKQIIDLIIDFYPLLIMYFATGFCVINDSLQTTCRESFHHMSVVSLYEVGVIQSMKQLFSLILFHLF